MFIDLQCNDLQIVKISLQPNECKVSCNVRLNINPKLTSLVIAWRLKVETERKKLSNLSFLFLSKTNFSIFI